MRRKNIRWGWFAASWIMIYLLAIAIGAFIATQLTYKANDHLHEIAWQDAEEYSLTGEFPLGTVLFRASAYVFGTNGVLRDCIVADGNNLDFSKRAAELIRSTADEGSVYKLIYDHGLEGRFAMIITVPMYENGEFSSVYFFVKSLTSLYGNLTLLFFSITFILLMSSLYSFLVIRKDRALETLRREYVANVSHELKSPIASIRALSEVMSEGMVANEAKIRKYSALILSESHKLENAVLSMLELSRLQSGHGDFSKTEVNAAALLEPITEKYRARCDESGITLSVCDGKDLLPQLFTNAACMAQLLDILLDNAVKFAGKNGNIRLDWTVSAKQVAFCVKDDGAGVSKENQRRIFDRFFKGDSSTNGSGLGLSIAAEIAAGLGEKLWVSSEPGKGSAFYFTVGIR